MGVNLRNYDGSGDIFGDKDSQHEYQYTLDNIRETTLNDAIKYLAESEKVNPDFKGFYLELIKTYALIGTIAKTLGVQNIDTQDLLRALGGIKFEIVSLIKNFNSYSPAILRIYMINLKGLPQFLEAYNHKLNTFSLNEGSIDSEYLEKFSKGCSVYLGKLDRLFNMN